MADSQSAPADAPVPVTDAQSAPADAPVPVTDAQSAPAPETDVQPDAPASEAVSDTVNELPGQVAAPEAIPQQPTPETAAPAEAPAAGTAVVWFGTTANVDGTEYWQNVNLVRIAGYTGPMAQVNGQLNLGGVLIEGAPALGADLLSCFSLGPTGSIAILDPEPLSLSLSAFSFNKGSKKTLSLYENGAAIGAKQAKWSSSNAKVAKVSKGVVSAKKAGSAVITATRNGVTASCVVVVTDYKQVKSVKLSASRLNLALYGGAQLSATIKPADAYNPVLTWASSAPEIASVDQNGTVAGLSGGKATITATAPNGKSAKCVVTVKEIKPTALALNRAYVTLNPGGQFSLQPQFTPSEVTNPAVSYASDNPAVATVDAGGQIAAVGTGIANITVASAAVPGLTAACRVSVVAPGTARMAGLTIGINPGHQKTTIKKKYPLAPGSSKTAYGVKTGACGKWTRVNEYETVLQIGLKLAKLLTDEGATVVITRTSNDVMLTNIDRAKMLNDAGVDVALQLHCNSVSNASHNGCSGYIRTTGDWPNESRAIAQALTAAISAATGCVDLGVKINNNYMSLNWTTTPSVLLELGYLTNRREDELLATDEYRQKMAEGIRDGLCVYFGR